MKLTADQLEQLSGLLDTALDLPQTELEAWLGSLSGEALALVPLLRDLLARRAARETGELLDRVPAFTVDAAVPASPQFQAGEAVGPYRLQRELGRGGMGEVWLAERGDGQLKRAVALKLPIPNARRSVLVQRFARERDILGSLEHPHIARLYDAGFADDGQPYLAMEYVQGQPLDRYCKQHLLGVPERLGLLLQVAEAVAFAHSRLVLHRDLKPSNILVTAEAQVRLLDFGIAKLMQGETTRETELTLAAGRALTLDYASPEQIRGAGIGTASDVYSLGVVAFELLAGVRPYRLARGSAAELEEAITAQEPASASSMAETDALRKQLRGDIDAILNKALKKHPAERYATIDALAQDWRRHLAGQRVLARPDTWGLRLWRMGRRHRLPLAAGALVVTAFVLGLGFGATALVMLALVVGLAAALWQAGRAREQARVARDESRRAQAVQGFLLDIFRANADTQQDPARAREATARELLDLGAQRLATALHDTPQARAEVMATLAEMYLLLGLDDRAADLESQRVELLRRLHGQDDRRVAQALVHLSFALHTSSRRAEILPALEEAKRILDAIGDRDSSLRGELLVRLAQRNYSLSLSRSMAYADEAVAVLRAAPDAGRDLHSTALGMSARVHQMVGDLAVAQQLWRASIREIQGMPEVSQLQLVELRCSLADTLVLQLEVDAALPIAREAVETGSAAVGEADPVVLVARSRYASVLHAAGQRVEARQEFEASLQAILDIKGDADTFYTPDARLRYARSLLAEGRLGQAQALVQAANATFRQHYAGSSMLGMALHTQARIMAALGHYEHARHLFEEGRALWNRGTAGAAQPWRLNIWTIEVARLDLAEQRAQSALALLQGLATAAQADIAAPRLDDIQRDTLAALAHLQIGDGVAAERCAQAAVQALPGLVRRGRQPGTEADAWLALGSSQLALARTIEAGGPIMKAVALRHEFDDPSSPWRAQAEVVRGRWLLASGDREGARAALDEAQRIHRLLGEAAPHWAGPLEQAWQMLDAG